MSFLRSASPSETKIPVSPFSAWLVDVLFFISASVGHSCLIHEHLGALYPSCVLSPVSVDCISWDLKFSCFGLPNRVHSNSGSPLRWTNVSRLQVAPLDSTVSVRVVPLLS